MPKKPKCSSCSTGWCKNHVFELNPLLCNLYYKRDFKIRLCPRLSKQSNQFQRIIPLLNQDKKYYTPSFYLDDQKKYYHDNDERVLRSHKLKVEEDANSNQIIWVARHARKRNYCFVCKEDYEDYLDHMQSEKHKKYLRENHYTNLIMELQQKMKLNNNFVQQKKQFDLKRDQTAAEDSSSNSLSQSNPKCFQFLKKLIKPNENLQSQSPIQKIQQN